MRTRNLAGAVAGAVGLGALAACVVRVADARRAEVAWAHLAGLGATARPERFDPAMVEG